ncbi:hypothetical protein [Kribbella sp. C-35]|uniref:hypothetical protein n=1 Tax=Kribbella sp. C-35 TaxID=2789276 RepID=UPI00397BACF0
MATLSAVYGKPEGVLGFTDYLSATWGDSVLLPSSIGTLVYAYHALPATRGDRVLVLVGGLCGAVGGLLTQVQWLRDDDPQLNWTLPAPHVFNGAGLYHAVFLTAAAAAFGAAWSGSLLRWAHNPEVQDWRVDWALGTALASGLGFAGLLVVDNQYTTDRPSSASTLAALAGAAALSVGGVAAGAWFRRKRRRASAGRRSL